MQAQDIIQFWFSELSNKQRFAKDPELDAAMRERFGPTVPRAGSQKLLYWTSSRAICFVVCRSRLRKTTLH